MKLYEGKNVALDYDENVPCIHVIVEGFVSGQVFRDLADKGLEFWKEKRKNHSNLLWLADSRKLGVLAKEETDWLANDWNVRAAKAGLDTIAFIVPESVFGEMTVKNYTSNFKDGNISSNFFDSVVKAKEWFKNKIEQPV